MKKIVWIILLLIPAAAQADDTYPWRLTFFGGGASLCDEIGCFGPTTYNFGASFGRPMSDRWSFELEGSYSGSTETLPTRIDPFFGPYTPELNRSRIWAGGSFLGSISKFGDRNDLFIALGLLGGYERQDETAPEGVFSPPPRDIGVNFGLSAGAGFHLWFSESWALRPEARFYLVANDLSGLRYTVGFTKEF